MRLIFALLVLPALLHCDEDTGPVLLPPCEDLEPERALLDKVPSTLVGTVQAVGTTTPMNPPAELNPVTYDGEMAHTAAGIGLYQRGPGLERVQRIDLGGSTTFQTRRSLSYFALTSDPQLVDDESPARLAGLDLTAVGGAVRPQEASVVHAMSAMSRTLARIETPERPYDFGIVTGDCADSAQKNELRWFIDTMDGTPVHADSGEDNDPTPGPANDPKDPFDPVEFPAPWYMVVGNHDTLVVGVLDPVNYDDAAVGDFAAYGTRDYTQFFAPVEVNLFTPADPERRILLKSDIISELMSSPASPGPVGHGFSADSTTTHGANYVLDAIPGLLRIIHLDTTDDTGGSLGVVLQSTVDNFLVPALEQAKADNVLVMLASHHSHDTIDNKFGETGDPIPGALTSEQVTDLVTSHPNVIAWLVGHIHNNRIRAIAGSSPSKPGYWEIASASLVDWPQQARVAELVDNGNGTLSIFATTIDFDEESCMERRYRRLGLMDYLTAWGDEISTDPADQNVELVIPVPAGTAASIAAATGFTRIESETTLRGLTAKTVRDDRLSQTLVRAMQRATQAQ